MHDTEDTARADPAQPHRVLFCRRAGWWWYAWCLCGWFDRDTDAEALIARRDAHLRG